MIVTSNKPFSGWGEIFGDEITAAAMVDRLVHHAEILSLKGCSYVKHGIIEGAGTGVVGGCRIGIASAARGGIGREGSAAMSSFQTVRASWRLRQRSASCRLLPVA